MHRVVVQQDQPRLGEDAALAWRHETPDHGVLELDRHPLATTARRPGPLHPDAALVFGRGVHAVRHGCGDSAAPQPLAREERRGSPGGEAVNEVAARSRSEKVDDLSGY